MKAEVWPLKSWDEYDEAVRNVRNDRDKLLDARFVRFKKPLFRGQGYNNWPLETTLQRATDIGDRSIFTLSQYYERLFGARPAIETITDRRWDIPDPVRFLEQLRSSDNLPHSFIHRRVSDDVWRFLLFLRHHGCPSPLLDWTASPYVAAFFAFDAPPLDAQFVSVFVLLGDVMQGGFASDPFVINIGHHIRTDKRHLFQQSEYTLCVRYEADDYHFMPHGVVLQDHHSCRLIRIDIPSSSRVVALQQLDLMNVNALSLFGSDEALVKTEVRRSFLFR